MKHLLVTLAVALCSLSLLGQQNIDSLAIAIAANSPSIQATALQGTSEAEAVRAENILSDPSADFEGLWGNRLTGNKYTAGISQQFKLPPAYSSRRKLADAMQTATEANVRTAMLSSANQAAQLLTQIAFDRKIVSLQDSVAIVASNRMEILDSMLKRGETTRLELHKAKVERMNALGGLQATKRRIAAAIQSLAALSGDPHLQVGELLPPDTSEPPLVWEAYRKRYLDTNPYTESAMAERSVATGRLNVIKADRWPEISLGYIYNNEMGEHFHGMSVGVTIPVYSRKKQKAAAQIASQSVLAEEHAALNEVLADMKLAHDEAMSLWAELVEWRKLISDDNDLALIDRMEQVGRITRPDALAEISYMLGQRVTMLSTERDYATALVRLRR